MSAGKKALLQRLRQISIIGTIWFISWGTAQAEGTLQITDDYKFTTNTVLGPGEALSSLKRGSHFANSLNFLWENKKDNQGLSLNFGLNITDDSTVDPKRLSLTNFALQYDDLSRNIVMGDTMSSYSQYSMTSSLKGISYRYQAENKTGPEINLVYGSQYARWDNFWDDDLATKSTPRVVSAARIKQAIGDTFLFGINFARSHDRSRLNTYDTLYDTHVYSLDWEYKPSPIWTYNGEYARSTSGIAAGEDSVYEGSRGQAFRFSGVAEEGKRRLALDYERVTPKFLTLTGSASTDREKIKVGWRDRLGLGSTYHATVYWDRNNLSGLLTTSTQNINYETGVTFQQAFGRENGSLDISLVLNREHDTDTSNRLEKTLNFNYKDNFHGIDADATVGYTRNDTTEAATQYNWSHNLTMSTNIVKGKTSIVPTLTITHSKQAISDFTSRVMNRQYSLGVTITDQGGNSLSLAGGWKKDDYYTLSDNASNWFANLNWTFKPAFLKSLGATSMYIKVGINDYKYTTSNRNYRENSVVSGVKCEF